MMCPIKEFINQLKSHPGLVKDNNTINSIRTWIQFPEFLPKSGTIAAIFWTNEVKEVINIAKDYNLPHDNHTIQRLSENYRNLFFNNEL